ncbi:uncharacterized protein M437DRAFT_65688 [Aureobasidium melanogenum CBS 110374]|uniref:Mid2 domain-containing protein n=1 Tax=Aureobasidium melanogenum (strain CBS 110374) TaxID=1043003 RepID=A0A074VV15_AURM1|nr:uncharacterized protein M437DRAFT_65688 [Aureobasidium melanogenum CBS 110374]KEQ63079.1 hypothetical protein M437DRAFT_65688 [Aureobasidium melanogenum CBS 110374]
MSSEVDNLSTSPSSSATLTSTMVVTETATGQASTTTALVTSVVTATDSATESIPAVVVTVTATATPKSTSRPDLDEPHEHRLAVGSTVGFFLGLFALLVLLGVALYYWRRRRLRRREANRAQEASAAQGEEALSPTKKTYKNDCKKLVKHVKKAYHATTSGDLTVAVIRSFPDKTTSLLNPSASSRTSPTGSS